MTPASLHRFARHAGGYVAAAQLLADIADQYDVDDPELQGMRLRFLDDSRQCLYLASTNLKENVQ